MADKLFDTGDPAQRAAAPAPDAPLAVRLRPRSLDELVGQEHLLGTPEEPTALRRAITEARPHSMVLHGPPGSGKTTLARIVAGAARAAFEELSAVQAGRAEVRGVIERASHRRQATGEPTVFFLDEIHRFNKAQQDALLPAVEEGLVTLIGATTENPYFEVNAALLSRTQVYELHTLAAGDIEILLRRALERGESGSGRSCRGCRRRSACRPARWRTMRPAAQDLWADHLAGALFGEPFAEVEALAGRLWLEERDFAAVGGAEVDLAVGADGGDRRVVVEPRSPGVVAELGDFLQLLAAGRFPVGGRWRFRLFRSRVWLMGFWRRNLRGATF